MTCLMMSWRQSSETFFGRPRYHECRLQSSKYIILQSTPDRVAIPIKDLAGLHTGKCFLTS